MDNDFKEAQLSATYERLVLETREQIMRDWILLFVKSKGRVPTKEEFREIYGEN